MDSFSSSWRKTVQSKTTLAVVAALAVGAVGGKFLLGESRPAINVPVASAKPAATASKVPNKGPAARTSKNTTNGNGGEPGARGTSRGDAAQLQAVHDASTPDAAAAPVAAAPVRIRPQPRGDADITSDTEGLFTMAALHQGAGPDRTQARGTAGGTDLGERVTSSTGVAPAAPDPLGATFIDEHNGFSIRFPIGWSVRTFAGEPWVLDCGDGKAALMSIGFSPFPAEFTADNIPPEWIARRISKRADTVLHAQGTAVIQGRKALWSKSTGPLPLSNQQPRMTRQTYIVPLGDGRVMEIRIAAQPEQFERIAPVMKKSIASMRVTAASRPATEVARTE